MKFTINIKLFILFLLATAISFLFLSRFEFPKSETIVILSDHGFSPDNITINKSSKVKWLVKGKNQYWPASDFHPTHGEYPEKGGCIGSALDACRAMRSGESYSFTFNKSGIWGIHDHLHPGSTMVIKVSVDDNYSKEIDSKTLGKMNQVQQGKAIKLIAKSDPAKAWELLKKTFIVNNQTVGNAHALAHVVGNEAYNKYGLNGMGICSNEFAFGCYHGVSEKMLLVLGKSSIKKIELECTTKWPPEKSQNFTGCIHGTGHGLIAWHAFDLKKAIIDCDILNKSNRNYCYSGVMMEFMESAPNSVFDKDDPWKLCLKFDGEIQRLCGQYQIITLTSRFHLGDAEIVDVCSQAPNQILKENCFHGFGSRTAQQSYGSFGKIKVICRSVIDNSGRNTCFAAAADQVVFQGYVNWDNVSQMLCEMVEEPEREKCINQKNLTMNFYKKKPPTSGL